MKRKQMCISVYGQWGMWSTWSVCDVTCGTGLQHRRRNCDNPKPAHEGDYCPKDNVEYKTCANRACDGG